MITAEFEPIAELATGRIVGLDAHPRVATLPHRSYDAWLADAEGADLLLDFELSAFRASVSALPVIPEDLFVEFEVTQSTATEGRFRRAIRGSVAPRVVLGFSPLAPAAAAELEAADPGGILATLRARGIRVAARDAGPGFESLRHLSNLSPDLARLDPTLIRSLGQTFSSHSVVAAVVACAGDVGARPDRARRRVRRTAARAPEPRCRAGAGADRGRADPVLGAPRGARDVGRAQGVGAWRGSRRAAEPLDPGWCPVSRRSRRLSLIAVGTLAFALTGQPSANAACPVLDAACQAGEVLGAGEGLAKDTTEPVDTPVDGTVDPIVDDGLGRIRDLLGGGPIDLPDPTDEPGGGHRGTGPRPPGSPDSSGRGIGGRNPDGPGFDAVFGPIISASSGIAPPERGDRSTGSTFGDALGGVARSLAIVLALFGLAVAFVAIQDHLDRNDPRLALAPVDSDVVEFA